MYFGWSGVPELNRKNPHTEGLQAAHPFCEGGGFIVHDVSGFGRHCYLHNGATPVRVPGGTTRTWVGTEYGPSWYTVNDTGWFTMRTKDFILPGEQMTVFSRSSVDETGTKMIAVMYGVGASSDFVFYLYSASKQYYGRIFDNGGTSGNRIGRGNTFAGTITLGDVADYAMTYDGSRVNGGIRLYIDGVRKDTSDSGAGSYTARQNSVPIALEYNSGKDGTSWQTTGKTTLGLLWNRGLSPAAVAEISARPHDLFLKPTNRRFFFQGFVPGAPPAGSAFPFQRYYAGTGSL